MHFNLIIYFLIQFSIISPSQLSIPKLVVVLLEISKNKYTIQTQINVFPI